MNAPLLFSAGNLILLAGLLCFMSERVGRLLADPVFIRYEFLADCSTAKVISQIDLYGIATNNWSSSDEERSGKFIVRATLDKARYQLGEPVHLFVYRQHHSSEYTLRPKSGDYEIIRPVVNDRRNRAIPLSPAGEWHASFSNLFVTGYKWFPTNVVKIDHIDLTELVNLTEPGQYLVYPRILLDMGPGTLEQPSAAELRAIPFEVVATRFERPTNAPTSQLMAAYQQHINEQAGRRLPLTDLEKELSAQSEQGLKEAMERHRQFVEAQAREAALANVPAAPARPVAPQLQVETDVPSRRPLRWPLLAAVAAVLAVLGWLWRRRGA